jgi:hypothetical protein
MSESSDQASRTQHPKVNLESIDLLEKLAAKESDSKNKDEMSIPSELVRLTSASEIQTARRWKMRFIVLVKANKESEAGVMPTQEILEAMGKYNEELVKAGVMLAGEGLAPSSKGARVRFGGPKQSTVIDGPFPETKELVAGFWIWQCRSLQEAIDWLKRSPFQQTEVEIRQIFEFEDFGKELTPELREQEERLRREAELLANKSKTA